LIGSIFTKPLSLSYFAVANNRVLMYNLSDGQNADEVEQETGDFAEQKAVIAHIVSE